MNFKIDSWIISFEHIVKHIFTKSMCMCNRLHNFAFDDAKQKEDRMEVVFAPAFP